MSTGLDENVELNSEDLQYFAKRAEYLCSTGNTILVSNFEEAIIWRSSGGV